MGIRSKIAAFCCCLLFYPTGLSRAETQASAAVQPFAGAVEMKPEETEELETRAPSFSFFNYRASGSGTLNYSYTLERDSATCRFTLRDAKGRFIDEENIKRRAKSRKVQYSADLDEGVYTLTIQEYDEMGKMVFQWLETFYFLTNASIVVQPYAQSRGVTVATVHGKKQFDWFPVLDDDLKVLSSRYRFRITAESIDDRKEDFKYFGERVIVDETMHERWHVVDADRLPSGTYSVKVWAYDSGGAELACWQMTLICQQRWTIYDYDLVTDLDFTPGEAITRQHATGDKSETLVAYDAVLPEVSSLPMTKLTVGGETLEAGCSGMRFTASITGDTMTLYTSGAGDWQIRQNALGTLKKSGIRILRLMDGNGKTRELSTGLTFSGRQYALLRAKGFVSKDFLLTAGEDGWRVKVDGKTFDLAADGTLIPLAGETKEEGAA